MRNAGQRHNTKPPSRTADCAQRPARVRANPNVRLEPGTTDGLQAIVARAGRTADGCYGLDGTPTRKQYAQILERGRVGCNSRRIGLYWLLVQGTLVGWKNPITLRI